MIVLRADTRQYVGPPTVAAIAQMLTGGVQVKRTLTWFLRNNFFVLQELVAKGVIEASEEEMDDLVKADIVAVATFCNQHSLSGKILTLFVCNYVS